METQQYTVFSAVVEVQNILYCLIFFSCPYSLPYFSLNREIMCILYVTVTNIHITRSSCTALSIYVQF